MTAADQGHGDRVPAKIDTKVAHAARVYNYYLGGTTYFEVDRLVADEAAKVHPGGLATVQASVQSNRTFLIRAVQRLASETGVRQFLDIGAGIPDGTNVHVVAQQASPGARVVYVDYADLRVMPTLCRRSCSVGLGGLRLSA